MRTQEPCPESAQLRRLLDGTLSVSDQAGLTSHLETCAACQQQLAALSAQDELCPAMARRLGRGQPGSEPGLREALAKVKGAAGAGEAAAQPGDADDRALDFRSPSDQPGQLGRIGPYKLLQQIGEGGMGTVFMAEQTQPVQRKVALKVIKAGMDSRQVIARFEAERQALALMDHVNIARVLDAGATESGRPYFVMELVHGVPITQYCDDNRLTPRERLELFVPICQAIQHAHQKGIIHRDVKPSNVMITLYDGKPVPKVIDFGVAKATEQKLTERTLFTQYGTMVGTLEYMSPEQAALSALGVDTRSDIFSLGVLLYELLTGSTPLSHQRVREAAYGEILRLIREEEAPRPSTRLSDSGAALASISAQRHMEPAKLTKLMRGELDWIVMKCLEKDRNRRYETASGFAADVQRYLNDEPVQACPPSAWYRLRKFVRRNKGPVLAVAVVLLALVVGIVGTTWGLVEARRQQKAAEQARHDEAAQRRQAELERDAKEQARKEAEQQKATAEAINRFLTQDLLAAARPEGQGKDVSMKKALDAAIPRISKAFAAQPDVEAAVRLTVGNTYHSLGAYPEAERHLRRALELYREVRGDEHVDTLAAVRSLASNLGEQWKHAEAEPLSRQYLDACRRLWGPEHPTTLAAINNYGLLLGAQGKSAEQEALFRPLLECFRRLRGPEHPQTQIILNNLAMTLGQQGKLDEAEPLLRQALEANRRLGNESLGTLGALNNLAYVFRDQGKLDEAERLFREGLPLARKLLPEDHYSLHSADSAREFSRVIKTLRVSQEKP